MAALRARLPNPGGSIRKPEVGAMLDIAYLLLAAAGFVALALAVRGIEKI
jgi:hypothetical protein